MTATHASDIEKVIREVKEELGPAPGNSLYEAIRRGNKDVVRKSSTQLSGLSTLGPKNEAILVGRPDFLKLLLARDSLIEEEIVATACERKDRESIRTFLDFGWPINRPIHLAASLLWSVKYEEHKRSSC